MGLREQQADLARQALSAAARQEFEAKGFEGASIRGIAEAAGMATGTVFNYAQNKLELLHQVLFGDLELSCAAAMRHPTAPPLVDQLVGVAGSLIAAFLVKPGLSRVLLRESLFAAGPSGEAFRGQVHRVAANVMQRIEGAKSSGAVSATLDSEAAALLFVSIYYFALISCLAEEAPDLPAARRRIRRQLQQVFQEDRS